AAVEAIAFCAQVYAAGVIAQTPRGDLPFQVTPEGLFLGTAANAPRVAMLIGAPPAAGRPDWWPLRLAELPRQRSQATSLRLDGVLALGTRSRRLDVAYQALLALADEAQRYLAMPARVPTVAALRGPANRPRWDEEQARVLVAALGYGRALPLAHQDAIDYALRSYVTAPLSRGESTPARAAREAALAIDGELRA
ncbi:MAG: hypothetical protein ACRDJN_09405, partial [Chloroflexota bacterium]